MTPHFEAYVDGMQSEIDLQVNGNAMAVLHKDNGLELYFAPGSAEESEVNHFREESLNLRSKAKESFVIKATSDREGRLTVNGGEVVGVRNLEVPKLSKFNAQLMD